MGKPFFSKHIFILIIGCTLQVGAQAQRFLSDYDSTAFIKDTLRPLVKRLENIAFSGYIQPQYQVAQEEGAPSYNGGNFSAFSNNRFMLRRARIKIDYLMPSFKNIPKSLFTFQVDATERGVNVRDMFLRVYEPSKENFSATIGLVARPFGYEVNLSSGYRESPERGRMSQILMTAERDLGAMITFEPHPKKGKQAFIKWDAGVFNGQGLSGPTDFDSYKDIISRITFKPTSLAQNILISGGISFLKGGWRQATQYKYEVAEVANEPLFVVDSSIKNIGTKAPRNYYGADVQLILKNAWGKTELRGEYWRGTQSGTASSTTNPGVLPLLPTYIRPFDGAFFYFLQNIINEKWEAIVKYDWYDPNRKVSGTTIGKATTNFTEADIKFGTWGFGLTHYFNDNLKLLAYYERVKNEATLLPGFVQDAKDNVLTIRWQLRF